MVEDNLIQLQLQKEITSLYKTFLEILEDIKKDHETMMEKVALSSGGEFSNNINYFTSSKYEQLRKRVLDNGNDHLRSLSSFIDYFDFIINKEKVEEAAKKRVVVKKVIISGATQVT